MESLHVGTPPSDYECWETKIIYIHNFLDLPNTKSDGNRVYSPEFKCFGHAWRLEVFPGGDSTAKDGWVSAFLSNYSDDDITVDWNIILLKADGTDSQLVCYVGDENEIQPQI